MHFLYLFTKFRYVLVVINGKSHFKDSTFTNVVLKRTYVQEIVDAVLPKPEGVTSYIKIYGYTDAMLEWSIFFVTSWNGSYRHLVDMGILFSNMNYPYHECLMTFWPLTNSDFSSNQTFHQFHYLDTELDLHRIMSGFHGAFATGVACQQGTARFIVVYEVFVFRAYWETEMATLASDLLSSSDFSLHLPIRIQWNSTGSRYSMTSSKFVLFMLIGKSRCPPWSHIGWNILYFSSATVRVNKYSTSSTKVLFSGQSEARWLP